MVIKSYLDSLNPGDSYDVPHLTLLIWVYRNRKRDGYTLGVHSKATGDEVTHLRQENVELATIISSLERLEP